MSTTYSPNTLSGTADDGQPGTVYLLHFDRPFGHARHYMGWASNLDGRLRHHRRGTGANLMRHVGRAGITWRLAATWKGATRNDERRMKNHGHARRCPICNPASKAGVQP
jgi:predicted GIY-YIG superfamily endonuclease